MNKKFFAVLMSLVMLIGLMPMGAFAAEHHECGGAWTSNGDGTHSSFCDEHGEVAKGTCQSINGEPCYMCKANMNPSVPEEPECDHEGGEWVSNDDGTHTSSCDCGSITTSGPCYDIGSGKCYMCGYEFPSHECDYADGVTTNNNGTHNINCECGKFVAVDCLDNDGDGACDSCDYRKYEEPECDHKLKGVSNNNDGTHNVVCRDCLEVLEEGVAHEYNQFDTCACGAVKPVCEHEWKGVVNNGENHNVVCRDCGEVLDTESHKYVDGRPCDCGAIYVEDQCEHEWKGIILKDEATHTIVCRDCLEELGAESHKYVDGRPCDCGAIYAEDECEHEWKGVVNNGENHNVVCRDCLEVLEEGVAHEYNQFDTCACGAVKPSHECDYAAGVTTNNDGTHNINCECGKFVTVNCLDNDGDGACDSCGYKKYADPEEDHVHEYETISNGDGTHTTKCECGASVTVSCLDNDGDGACDSCGYMKYPAPVAPEEPEDKPDDKPEEPEDKPDDKPEEPDNKPEDKPAADTSSDNLDAVPNTGNGIVYALAAMMAIGVAGTTALFVYNKKRI